jgi:hypothetical protein
MIVATASNLLRGLTCRFIAISALPLYGLFHFALFLLQEMVHASASASR